MLGKIAGISMAFLFREVRGEMDMALHIGEHMEHMKEFHMDHMNPEVWEQADNFTAHHMHDFMREHRENLKDAAKDMFTPEDVKCDKCKCKKCVMKGGKYVMMAVWGKVKKWCMGKDEAGKEVEFGVQCSMKKAFCMAAKKHPMVMTGYLMYHVRPGMMAYDYCMGAGYCKHEHHSLEEHFANLTETELAGEDHSTYIEPHIHHEFLSGMHIRGGKCQHGHHQEELMNEITKKLRGGAAEQVAKVAELPKEEGMMQIMSRRLTSSVDNVKDWFKEKKDKEVKEMKEFDQVMNEMGELPHMKNMSPKCFVKVMKVVMGMAIKHVIMMCKKTDNKMVQKMCMFAGKHKAIAFGAMLAHVQPEKFAIGRCWGREHEEKMAKSIFHQFFMPMDSGNSDTMEITDSYSSPKGANVMMKIFQSHSHEDDDEHDKDHTHHHHHHHHHDKEHDKDHHHHHDGPHHHEHDGDDHPHGPHAVMERFAKMFESFFSEHEGQQ